MNQGLVIETPPLDVYEQMAADEVLCGELPCRYILRFYNWKNPGITFGYSQRYKTIYGSVSKEISRYLEMARRPTGGGIVFHESDVTFSLIFPWPREFKPMKAYSMLHTAVNAAYRESGIKSEISNAAAANYDINHPAAMNCFSNPVDRDILYNGKKILGGALRSFGDYMLYQASIQAENARTECSFHREIITKAFAGEFNVIWVKTELSESRLEKTKELALLKYRTVQWNERI
ncbi:MAG: hypothetical protein HY746_03890 [Elusimicrobia bacterium]|nr:hypothetical protein [Elusimicrobiota bacterium]